MLPARHFLRVKQGKTYFCRVQFAVQRENMCPAPASCTSSIPDWGRTEPADSDSNQQCRDNSSPPPQHPHKHSSCHSIAPGLSRAKSSFSCHPRQGNQPLVMWSAKDGASDTGFPGDYTGKKLSVGCKHCEKERRMDLFFFFFFLHQLFIMINAKS